MKRWNILSEFISGKSVAESLLIVRGYTTKAAADDFLAPPSLSSLTPTLPEELRLSLKSAAALIHEAINSNYPVVVHGDYDADGISATAILYKTLKYELSHNNTFYFIPSRFDHGYGLSKSSIDAVLQRVETSLGEVPSKVLFITVDSGITADKEVSYIKSLGHDVIITDHHQKPDTLPKADCIVWYDKVVGATLSWMLSGVLGSKNPQHVSLAALATVTDLQPLTGYNRSVVKKGLEVLNTNPLLGLKKLLETAGKAVSEIDTYELGWVIGPRLNALGRLVEAEESLLLLLETNEATAYELAFRLNSVNAQRQDKTFEMYELSASLKDKAIPKIIVTANKDYHEGIIGLVASRLVQQYYRPTIVISISDGYAKGSVRSIAGIDIISVLREFGDLFENLGGHPMAAGFTIKTENIPELTNKLTAYADEHFSAELFIRVLNIDMEISLSDVTLELYEELEKFKPFGIGNEEPVFCSKRVGVAAVNTVGKENQHLSLRFYHEGATFKGILFNGAKLGENLAVGDRIDIAYTLKKNVFNGKTSIDLILKDIINKPSN